MEWVYYRNKVFDSRCGCKAFQRAWAHDTCGCPFHGYGFKIFTKLAKKKNSILLVLLFFFFLIKNPGFPWIFRPNSINFHQNHTLKDSSHFGSGLQDFTFLPCGGIRAESAPASGCCGPSSFSLLWRARVARGWNFWSATPHPPPPHILSLPLSQSVLSCHQGVGFIASGGARH